MCKYTHTTPFSLEKLKKCREFYRQHPDGLIMISQTSQWTRLDYQRWFMTCLHRKINRGTVATSRKHNEQWQIEAMRTAIKVNGYGSLRRIVHYFEVPKDFRTRLTHRLTHPDEL